MKKTQTSIVLILALSMLIGCFFNVSAAKNLDTDSATLKLIQGFESKEDFPACPDLRIDTEDKKEGSGSAKITAYTTNGLAVIEKYYDVETDPAKKSIDLSAYAGKDDAYVYFWLYVKDASLVEIAEIEFSSGGGWGANNWNIDLAALDLKDGWNEIYLPMSSFKSKVGDIDWSKINYFRIYVMCQSNPAAEQILGLDAFYVGNEADFNKVDTNPGTGSGAIIACAVCAASARRNRFHIKTPPRYLT